MHDYQKRRAAWDRAYSDIQARVRIVANRAIFSAYPEDDDGNPVDNLDEIPARGTFRVVQVYDPFWGEGKAYESAPLTDPTWLDLCRVADEIIETTGDRHHVFLEAVRLHKDGTAELIMGS